MTSERSRAANLSDLTLESVSGQMCRGGSLISDDMHILQTFRDPLIGLPLSHLWRGAGSAIFLEFGRLTERTYLRRDGTRPNPCGEFGLMIQWSWRIEDKASIMCGSWSEEPLWEP